MKNARLGLLLIVSSLVVIAMIVALSAARQKEGRLEQIRIQGTGITRSLTAVPLELLLPKAQATSVLHSLLVFYKHSDFAYGIVTSPDSKVLGEVASPGVIPPHAPLPGSTSSLFGEHMVEIPNSKKRAIEFYGPVMQGGNVAAYIRIGYFEPKAMVAGEDLSFLAMLAFPTFLLVPFIYFILKREMKPLRQVEERLERMMSGETEAASVRQIAEELNIPSFAERVSEYLDKSRQRITELEADKAHLLTTNRILTYNSNKLSLLMNCLPDGVLILDPTGKLGFGNAKITPLLGIDEEAITGQPVESWCRDEALSRLLLSYRTQGAQNMRAETIEFHPAQAPGKRIRAASQPLVSATDGIAFGTLIVLRDVTAEHASQQTGHDFVAQVSHELKSPLNVISMYCEMLQNDIGNDMSMQIEATNVIHDATERMGSLVNNLLNISKMETGGLQPRYSRVKVDDLLQDLFSVVFPRAEASGISMELDIAKGIGAVQADKDMLQIAITNLLTNAVKYSEAGGKVTLHATEKEGDIVITVRDTGIGIPADVQSHVFDKFYRAEGADTQKRSGHGLGLYLANEIVRLHHGRITLESEPGQGSAFSVHLRKASIFSQEVNAI